MPELNIIEKPWGVYGWFLGPWGFGKIVRDSETNCDILYSENQLYDPESWSSKWVEKFTTLEEAVKYYIDNRCEADVRERQSSPDEIKKMARESFPSYFKDN